jgi:hypothetical protein
VQTEAEEQLWQLESLHITEHKLFESMNPELQVWQALADEQV